MKSNLPAGTVTFLFTDIEGSTQLLHRLGDGYAATLAAQRDLLRGAFQKFHGQEVDTQGDAFFVVFERAADAAAAAVMAQHSLAAHPWSQGEAVRVRMGLHTGEPRLTEMGYVGLAVHFAARLCAAGHGGQVLLSQSTRELVEQDLPEGVSLRDMGEHRLKDLQQPRRIFQLVIAGLPETFPPLKSLDALPNNLQIQLTSFIGRETEMAEIKRLLKGTRLLTLTGPGGTGKTRLALQVAADLLETFDDGVWQIELASLKDPALVPQVVSTTLGLREQPSQPILDVLTDYLRPKSLLLLLDNCEHLIDACAHLADKLLRACPHLTILATSREPLGIAGETAWSVPALSLPDPHQMSADALTQYESAQLFIDRAAHILPGFSATEQNARSIAQICQRLDGIPLAIELAAARVKLLKVESIAARLDDRFNLLTGGGRTTLPRHQTLRAAMDWSYDLLPEDSQLLFRRLAVFAGGFTLEAAEAVCSDELLPSDSQLELLARLVDRSLVIVDQLADSERYRMLETIREYAGEKLLESGEPEQLRNRHLDYFLAFAEKAEMQLEGSERIVWLNRLEREHDNLRAALDWSRTSEDRARLGLRLAGSLGAFWDSRGYLREGRERLSEALARVPASERTAERAKALYAAGELAYLQSDYPATRPLLGESISIYRELGPSGRLGVGHSLILLGDMLTEVGDYVTASTVLNEGLEIMRELKNERGIAVGLWQLGWCALRIGEYGKAVPYFEESLPFYRKAGNLDGMAIVLSGWGEVLLRQGDYARATALLEESLELRRELKDNWGIAASLGSLGWVELLRGDLEQAFTTLKESLKLRRDMGDKGGIAWCLERLAEVALTEGLHESPSPHYEDLRRATRLFAAAACVRAPLGSTIDLVDQPEHERQLALLRTQLDNNAGSARIGLFETAWAEGQAMNLEQAVEYALEATELPHQVHPNHTRHSNTS